MLFNVILEKAADIASVVQVAFAELISLLDAEILAQQTSALGQSVRLVCVDKCDIALPALAVFGAAQIFIGCAIALIAVFSGQDQHLVVLAVIETARVGQGVVDFGGAFEKDFGNVA